MKIIDAHMHPYNNDEQNIKWYVKKECSFHDVESDMARIGISVFCGSVISRGKTEKENFTDANETAFELYNLNSESYLPGVIIHPDFKEESCSYIKKAHDMGLSLIGELTPYTYGWKSYMDAYEIFEYADSLNMTVNCHPTNDEDMEAFAKAFPHMEIVYAHPGDKAVLLKHIERMQKYENVYIDLSGSGIQRYGAVEELIDKVGKERILFGTDYPVCNPAVYINAVMYENLSDDELEHIFYKNAQRVYKMK